jgi:hypothetical protein
LLSDYIHRDRFPAQKLAGFQPATASNELVVGGDEDGPQEAELPNALGQRLDVAQGLAEAVIDDDVRNSSCFRHGPRLLCIERQAVRWTAFTQPPLGNRALPRVDLDGHAAPTATASVSPAAAASRLVSAFDIPMSSTVQHGDGTGSLYRQARVEIALLGNGHGCRLPPVAPLTVATGPAPPKQKSLSNHGQALRLWSK